MKISNQCSLGHSPCSSFSPSFQSILPFFIHSFNKPFETLQCPKHCLGAGDTEVNMTKKVLLWLSLSLPASASLPPLSLSLSLFFFFFFFVLCSCLSLYPKQDSRSPQANEEASRVSSHRPSKTLLCCLMDILHINILKLATPNTHICASIQAQRETST